MVCIKKVGIHKDTAGQDSFVLHVLTKEGTFLWPFRGDDFLNGWSARRGKGESRAEAIAKESQARTGKPAPAWAMDAMEKFSVTPTLLRKACGHSSPHRVKWAARKEERR